LSVHIKPRRHPATAVSSPLRAFCFPSPFGIQTDLPSSRAARFYVTGDQGSFSHLLSPSAEEEDCSGESHLLLFLDLMAFYISVAVHSALEPSCVLRFLVLDARDRSFPPLSWLFRASSKNMCFFIWTSSLLASLSPCPSYASSGSGRVLLCWVASWRDFSGVCFL